MGGRIRNHLWASPPFCPTFHKAVTGFWCKIETSYLGEFLLEANTNFSEADCVFCFKTGNSSALGLLLEELSINAEI